MNSSQTPLFSMKHVADKLGNEEISQKPDEEDVKVETLPVSPVLQFDDIFNHSQNKILKDALRKAVVQHLMSV